MIFLEGIFLGLIPAFMAGPLTLALMYTSIEKSPKAGLVVGTGIWVSDLIYIALAYWGFRYIVKLGENDTFNYGIGLTGSLVLVAIGIGILLKKTSRKEDLRPKELKTKDMFSAFSQGFAINTFNPVAIVFWSSVMGAVVIERGWSSTEAFIFFTGTMVSVVGSDILKVLLAQYITKWLTPRRWKIMSKLSGYMFIVFGIAVLIRVMIG